MDRIKLLFVEDDAAFSYIVKNSLELTGKYEVQTASNGKEGREMYDAFEPDVIVADIGMPVLDGMEMVREIRERDKSVPVLLATGRTDGRDTVKGYELNVDNFIKKPYIPEELDAHIQAILRRTGNSLTVYRKGKAVRLGEYLFNADKRILQYKGDKHRLTDRETRILEILYSRKGELVLRKYLLEKLWNMDDIYTSRSLSVFVSRLRRCLSFDPAIEIETVRGEGLVLSIKNMHTQIM